jgi:hypothetical protein
MALNGIPIPDTQEIGDSLSFLNSALTTLDTRTSTGPLSLTGNVSAVAGTFTSSVSSAAVRGMFYGDGSNLTNLAAGNIATGTIGAARLPLATTSTVGGIAVAAGLSALNGYLSLVPPTGGALGGVKAGANITIASDGTISGVNSYVLPNATTSTLGGVIVAAGLSALNGYLSLVPPTGGALGGVKAGSNITIAADGTISGVNSYTLSAANSTGLGGVKIDGTFMTIDTGGSIKSPLDLGYNSSVWSTTLSANFWFNAAMSSDGTHRAALVYGGYVYVSNNGGFSWSARITDTTRNWRKVSISSSGQVMIAVADTQLIYVSTDYGVTWTSRYNSLAYRSVAVAPDGSRATAVAYTGRIYTTTDFINWSIASTPILNLGWRSVAMSNNGQFQTAVAYGDYIYRSADYGGTWSSVPLAGSRLWSVVAMSNSGQYQYASYEYGYIYRSADYGLTWSLLGTSPYNISDIATSTTGSIIYACQSSSGLVYKSTDYGTNWSVFNVNTNAGSFTTRNWTSVSTSSDGNKVMATIYSVPVLIYPAPRWTTTFGLSTNAIEANTINALSGTFTTSVSAPVVRGNFYGDGSSITNLAAGNIATGTLAAARLPIATTSTIGGVYQGDNITIAVDGRISGVNSYTLPNATTSTLGGVIVAAGLSALNGYLSLVPPTGGVIGGVKAGANITITADGTISGVNSYTLSAATTNSLGGIVVGSGLSVTNGNVSLVAATPSIRGGVRVDNSTITISNNDVISVNASSLTNVNTASLSTTITNPVISTEFVPALTDRNSVIVLTVDSGETYPFKIPTDAETNFPIGTQFTIVQGGIVPILLIPTNTATVNLRTLGINRNQTTGQNAVATLLKIANNTWIAGGNLI